MVGKERTVSVVNLAIRFATELAGFAAVGYAAFQVPAPLPVRVLVAAGATILVIGAWAVAVAPRGPNPMPPIQKDLIGSVILLGAAAALAWSGQTQLAIGFAIVVVANTVLLAILGTEVRERLAGAAR
jgi:hypothetical protein